MKSILAFGSLLFVILVGGAAMAADLNVSVVGKAPALTHQDKARMQAHLQALTSNLSAPASAPSGPVSAFSSRGRGVLSGASPGNCTGTACTASSCECLDLQGTAVTSGLGNSAFEAVLTDDTGDCVLTGDVEVCCPYDGLLIFSTKKDALLAVTAGQFCVNFWALPSTSGIYKWNGTYAIVPNGVSKSKYATSLGTGVFSLTDFADTSAETFLQNTAGNIQQKGGSF